MRPSSPFQLPDFQFIGLSYGGRTLQMRPSQLTTVNIARAFRLIPDTIILVSEWDSVALPQDGIFHDVDEWTVEGEKEKSLTFSQVLLRTTEGKVVFLKNGNPRLSCQLYQIQKLVQQVPSM